MDNIHAYGYCQGFLVHIHEYGLKWEKLTRGILSYRHRKDGP